MEEVNVTPREIALVQALAEGKISKEIAEHRNRSHHTIENSVARIRLKVGAVNTPHLVFIFCKAGLLHFQSE